MTKADELLNMIDKFRELAAAEAYEPVIEDSSGRSPEELRVKAPRGARAAIAAAARIKYTSSPEYIRLALLKSLAADGAKLRLSLGELTGSSGQ